jgi:tetratricopeptide (TPR) repeat protein
MRSGLLFLPLLLHLVAPVMAEDRLATGIEAFYSTDWAKADAAFNTLMRERPNEPQAYFFSAMMPFWTYFFAGEDPVQARLFLARSETAIRVAEARLKSNPSDTTLVLLLNGLHGYRSLVAASQKEYRKAMASSINGYGYTKRLMGYGADRPDALLGQGVLQYMIGSIPGEIRWMAALAGLSGDKSEGLRLLNRAASSNADVRHDATMILSFLYERENRKDLALVHLNRFLNRWPDNTVVRFRQARLLEETGRLGEAVSAYRLVAASGHPAFAGIRDISRTKAAYLAAGTSAQPPASP